MPDDKLKVRVELPQCGDEDCDCALSDTIEGDIQEVLQGIYDDTITRDKNIMEIVADLAETVVALYQVVEMLAPKAVKVVKLDNNDDGFNGKLN